jgi:cytochrome c
MAASRPFVATGVFALLSMAALLAFVTRSGAAEGSEPRAETNFRLNCSGCHLPDGTGKRGLVPALAGSIGSVFSAKGGREYIARIPGAANSFLNDQELSDVLNWMLVRFDREHLPPQYRPFTASEVGRLRKNPMSDVMQQRAALMHDAAGSAPAVAAQPPPAFALCGACHPTSHGGDNGIGPNLRGIVGRPAGASPGYMYSAAMKNSQINWGPDNLDRYIASPATTVPGNAMTYRGEPDPSARAAIIAYLQTLQ